MPPNTKLRPAVITIGDLSEQTGVNIETIRYYERIALLPSPPRSAGRHRQFDDSHRQHLAFIRRARELGFSIEEIRALAGLADGAAMTCDAVKAMTDRHIAEVREKIRDLKKLERVLTALARQCHGTRVPDCPILDALTAT